MSSSRRSPITTGTATCRGYTRPALRVHGPYEPDDGLRFNVTAVELLPVHHIIDESFLNEKGLKNCSRAMRLPLRCTYAARTACSSTRDAAIAGAAPTRETAKPHLIHRALALRARQADAFGPAGAYTPLEAGPGVCAFARGIAEVLVVAPLRDWAGAELAVPEGLRGLWRCSLTDVPRELGVTATVSELLVAPDGVALLERG